MTEPTLGQVQDIADAAARADKKAAAELEALGIYDQTSAQENAYARVLLIGPAKAGKTTCLALTSPGPALIINCDGDGATKGAAAQGAEFMAIDATNRPSWKRAVGLAHQLAAEGKVRTIIVDTVTLLCDNLLDDITVTLEGWEVWRELAEVLRGGIKKLLTAEAHVFVVAHVEPESDSAAGILPSIPGKMKVKIPGLLDDWILLDVEAERQPHERQFLLGPQKSWTHSGRNVKRTCAIPADVGELFRELGIKP
jgi:hypothetical protein